MFKVYISADLEGINGVVYPNQIEPSGEGYGFARKQQAKEVNCLVEALLQQGATHITLNDAHATMDNILLSDLNPKVELITGKPKPVSMLSGLDSSYDMLVFSGYHSMAGSENGVLAHTFSMIYKSVKLNGKLVGETELNAVYAGQKSLAVSLVTGDFEACRQASLSLGGVCTVSSKKAISTTAAICRPEDDFFEELRQKVEFVRNNISSFKPFEMYAPFTLELEFSDRKKTDVAALLPCVEKISDTAIIYESDNYEHVYRTLQFITAALG